MKRFVVGDIIYDKRYWTGGYLITGFYKNGFNLKCLKDLEDIFVNYLKIETDFESKHERRKRIIKEILC